VNRQARITRITALLVVLLVIGSLGVIGVLVASATDGGDNTTISVTAWSANPAVCNGHKVDNSFNYDVTNNSSLWDASVTITDNLGFSSSYTLAPGGSKSFKHNMNTGPGTITATAIATFDDPAGTQYTASGNTTVHDSNCSITLEKKADPTKVCKETGTDVTYTYTITNNSDSFSWQNCPTCPALKDNKLGTIQQNLNLPPGQSKTYTKTATLNDTITNTASASGAFKDPQWGTIGNAQATVTVTGIVCSPTASAGGPYTVNEGSCVMLTGSGTDPQGLPLTYAWDLNGDGVFETPGQSVLFCGVDGPMTVPIALQVCDSAGLCGHDSSTVTINNVPPTVGPITASVNPVPPNTAINASANFTDPGVLDTHTAVWNWGDGSSSPGVVTETNGSGSVAGSHAYTAAGIYTVTLTVTDKDGGQGHSTYESVVYDPNGVVTGNGWINSPAGAYKANPKLTGMASFGFVANYNRGATVPTGATEFHFPVGNLNFYARSYQWLVVTGARAQCKGTGTINGTGNYGFTLTVIDGQAIGGGGLDKFRIKIMLGSNVIYDNQMGAPDSANPTTAVAGFNIVVRVVHQ